MNTLVVKNALGTLDKVLSEAKRARSQVQAGVFKLWHVDMEGGFFDDPRGAMAEYLQELCELLLVVLEAAEMPETRVSLKNRWGEFMVLPDKLEHTDDDAEYEYCTSPALSFLDRLIGGLRASVVAEISSEEAWILSKLEAMLEDTAALVHRRGKLPQKEHDVQEIMHDYLRASFSGFRLNPDIGGTLKNFKPDCGIASVGAAIEFKIAHSREEVAKAFSGIAEDTAAYKGSKDWTRFYAVVFQAKPFASKADFKDDMKRIGATEWKTILVNGPAKKKDLSKKKGPAKKKGKKINTKKKAA